MTRIIATLLLLCTTALAQTREDIGKIMLSVTLPPTMEGLTEAQQNQLDIKCIQLATRNGMATAGSSSFLLIPTVTILETNVADGGMKQITVVNAELNLTVAQTGTKTVFASATKKIRGSGATQEAAITNALSTISSSDATLTTFINTTKEKITDYYAQHCTDITHEADALMKRKEYEGALVMLLSVPNAATTCYPQAQKMAVTAYTAYENQYCSRQIQEARTLIAGRHFDSGLAVLRMVDPGCKCSKDASELISTTAAKVNAENKRAWDALLKVYSDEVALEHHRLDAITSIALSAYKSKRKR